MRLQSAGWIAAAVIGLALSAGAGSAAATSIPASPAMENSSIVLVQRSRRCFERCARRCRKTATRCANNCSRRC